MSRSVRLQALGRLANSRSVEAESALKAEFDSATATLSGQQSAIAVGEALEILEVIGFRFSELTVKAVFDFLARVESEGDGIFELDDQFTSAWHTDHLAGKAIDVALRLRYLQTKAVVMLLLRSSTSARERVHQKAKSGLDSVVSYEALVFFGDRDSGRLGIGPLPQAETLDVLEDLPEPHIAFFDQVRGLAEKILSPTVNGARWQSDSVQLSFGALPAIQEVVSVRERAIALLIRLYALAPTPDKKISVIGGLMAATRSEARTESPPSVRAMIKANTLAILGFFEAEIRAETAFPVVQVLESRAHRIFRSFEDPSVAAAALRIEHAISENQEYLVYRTLIGFESVFGPWTKEPVDGSTFRKTEEFRKARAAEYVSTISAENAEQWKTRILEFSKTESADLATFPIFYQFLRDVAGRVPSLALDLVSSRAPQVDNFLIPLFAGLWNGSCQDDFKRLIEMWMGDSEQEDRILFAAIKMFLSTENLDLPLLNRLLERAEERHDVPCLRQVASVAISRYEQERMGLQALFLRALSALTNECDAGWVYDAWYRPELKELLEGLDEPSTSVVLANLMHLPKLDYHAEEVLSIVSAKDPLCVFQYLLNRVHLRSENAREFEAIPFEFYKLRESLSEIQKEAVRLTLDLYREAPDEFRYGGASLLQRIFPEFPKVLESELTALVREPDSIDYVLDVLRNYEGESFLYDLLKEIIVNADGDASIENEVTAIVMATGVVHGEYGFAAAYENKLVEVSKWFEDPREPARKFAQSLAATLEKAREVERARAEESIVLRKHRYHED